MSTEHKNVVAKVKFYNREKGFGFVTLGKTDYFLHRSVLELTGFTADEAAQAKRALVDIGVGYKGRTMVTKIHELDKKSAYKRTIVDRNAENDLVVVKTEPVIAPGWSMYEVRSGGIDGELKSEHRTLSYARENIGKNINPPVPAGHGEKTNVPDNGPAKGPSQGQGASFKKQKQAA